MALDSGTAEDQDRDLRTEADAPMQEPTGINIDVLDQVDASKLRDGDRIMSLEEWLPVKVAESLGPDVVYVDRRTPLTATRVETSEAEQEELRKRFRPVIAKFMAEFGPEPSLLTETQASDFEPVPSAIADQFGRLEAIFKSGIISSEEYEHRRAQILEEATSRGQESA